MSIRQYVVVMTLFLSMLACSSGVTQTPGASPRPTELRAVISSTPQFSKTRDVIKGSQEYIIRQTISIVNNGPGELGPIDLWISLASDRDPYQDIISVSIQPNEYQRQQDEAGNEYIHLTHDELAVGSTLEVTIDYQAVINEVKFNLDPCTGQMPGDYLDPEPFIESNEQSIRLLADQLVGGKDSVCQQIRAIYDYVAGEMTYGGYDPGDVGALEASRRLSGDCSEFSDLMVALSRAAGIPARNLEGVTCCTSGEDYDEGQIKHSWVEVYLPSSGWVPMDPTWGRNLIDRETYFAGITPDHFAVSSGRNQSYLGGYHYYYFTYSYPDESPEVSHSENWSIVKK